MFRHASQRLRSDPDTGVVDSPPRDPIPDLIAAMFFDDARARGHPKKGVMRILKGHLSDVVYRQMTRDLEARLEPPESTSQEAALR
jgi:hypothetical protein